jgi:hypothetical protein
MNDDLILNISAPVRKLAAPTSAEKSKQKWKDHQEKKQQKQSHKGDF